MSEKLFFCTIGPPKHGKSTLIGHLLILTQTVKIPEKIQSELENAPIRKDFLLFLPRCPTNPQQVLSWAQNPEKVRLTADLYVNKIEIRPMGQLIAIDTPGHENLKPEMLTQEIQAPEKKELDEDTIKERTDKLYKNFLELWIKGIATIDVVLFVVSAVPGACQKVFSGKDETKKSRDLLVLLKTYSRSAIIFCINFMDVFENEEQTQKAFEETKDAILTFFKNEQFPIDERKKFIPISALTGENLIEKSPRLTWYKGPALLDLIHSFSHEKNVEISKLRVVLTSIESHKKGSAFVCVGIVEAGTLKKNDKDLVVYPQGIPIQIKTLAILEEQVDNAQQKDHVEIELEQVSERISTNPSNIIGSIIARRNEPPVVAKHFRSIIFTRKLVKKKVSYQIMFLSATYNCEIVQIIKEFASGEQELVYELETNRTFDIPPGDFSKNENLREGTFGIVEIEVEREIAFETQVSKKNSALGRFILKSGREIIAFGLILSEVKSP